MLIIFFVCFDIAYDIDFLKADIFVYPSIWEEAFGISVVEAMARGCIPITFKKGGLVEIIQNDVNGYLIDTISDEQLAKTIIKVINLQQQKKQEIIEKARKTAEDFTVKKTIESLEKAYKDIIIGEIK